MCGINGIFAYHYATSGVNFDELRRTRDQMAARGPDGKGEWLSQNNRVALGHRRLAIIDLSDAGAQPMVSADGRCVVTFNGEIYNYHELRRELQSLGYVFRSNSDTEVLLHLYAEKGEAMVRDLRGMFAFAIWDEERRSLFLARDPLGIKPLYYADDGWTFRFASQVKALRSGGNLSLEPDPAGWVGFLLWGSVPEPYTQFSAIRCLPAGCSMVVDAVGSHPHTRYFSFSEVYCKAERGNRVACASAEIRSALLESVRCHMMSDVPVCLFLSAGVDSGAILGLLRDVNGWVPDTITVAFDEFRGSENDESLGAREIAQTYGARNTRFVVTASDFQSDLPRILDAMDVPSIDGINSWFVSKAAAALGYKVAISGLGGDELFGGYPSFKNIPRWTKLLFLPGIVPGCGWVMRNASNLALKLGANFNPKVMGMLSMGRTYPGAYLLQRGLFMPWELSGLLDPEIVLEGSRRLGMLGGADRVLNPSPASAFGKVAALETQLYMRNQLLRDVDWASMAHSLEVRVPLADAKLIESVAPLTTSGAAISRGKEFLGNSPITPLPPLIINRKKTGFTTPIAEWEQSIVDQGFTVNPGGGNLSKATWARQWGLFIGQSFGLPNAHA